MFDRNKFILQFGNLAGWPFLIAKELRKRGIPSKNIIRWYSDVHDLKRDLPFDEVISKPNSNIFFKAKEILSFIYRIAEECSIIHYHGTNILFRETHHLFEGPLFRKSKIPMIITFGGGDARFYKISNQLNQYFYRNNNFFHDLRIKMRYKSWSKNIKFCATSEEMFPHAEPYFDKVYIFRQPIDLNRIEASIPNNEIEKPIILHTPTEPLIKGTKHVIKAIENLKKRGLNFEFRIKRKMTQKETQEEISKCDIYIDELLGGGYGVSAIESMAFGKPTISWIMESLKETSPKDLPIVVANPNSLEHKLTELILDANKRREIGKLSRNYVEKHHCIKKVSSDLIKMYEEIS